MIRIDDIVEKVAHNHAQADLDLLRRAYLFSAREHKGQKRASGESYLVHPLEVANILADMKLDEVSVATGLLHDVVEDTLVDLDTIRKYFGEEITHLVDGLTKIAQLTREGTIDLKMSDIELAFYTNARLTMGTNNTKGRITAEAYELSLIHIDAADD